MIDRRELVKRRGALHDCGARSFRIVCADVTNACHSCGYQSAESVCPHCGAPMPSAEEATPAAFDPAPEAQMEETHDSVPELASVPAEELPRFWELLKDAALLRDSAFTCVRDDDRLTAFALAVAAGSMALFAIG